MRDKIILGLFRLLSHLPLVVAQMLGTVVGLLVTWIPNRERHNAQCNIAHCFPEMPAAEQRSLLRNSLVQSARTLLEMPTVWFGDPARLIERIELGDGAGLPAQMLQRGKGVIIAAPHLGCWEIGVHYLATLSPIAVLYRPPRQQSLGEMIINGRSRGGATLVPTTGAGVKALYESLKQNQMVAILPDQQPRHAGRTAGVFAPFFGRPALTMVLINRLARKTGAAVIYGYLERLPIGSGYRIHFLPAPAGIDDPDSEVAATALNLGVEQCVRRCPEQYQWSYRRFSVTADGSRSIYKAPLKG